MTDPCADCPLEGRRDFVFRALAALGMLALDLPVSTTRALRRLANEVTFSIPDADSVQIDRDNEVIVVRSLGKAYVFNLSCPHQRTALRWQPDDNQFQCPKHHSKYRLDGTFISGRATRSMDRFAVRRDGSTIVADLDRMFREDENAADWAAAFITV